jgi:hypothetical protein
MKNKMIQKNKCYNVTNKKRDFIFMSTPQKRYNVTNVTKTRCQKKKIEFCFYIPKKV